MERNIVCDRLHPPVPSQQYDWRATFDDYDLGDPVGYGKTKQAAIDDLMSQLEDE